MPKEMATMAIAKPFTRFTGCLTGREKSGKTKLAGTGRKPILHLDLDKRREVLAGYKDVYSITYYDEVAKQPTTYSDVISLLTDLEQGKDLKQMGFDAPPGLKPRTIVVDSVASLAKAAMGYALYTNKDIRRQIAVPNAQIYLVGGWDGWNAEMSMVEQVVMRMLGLTWLDVILTLHVMPEEAVDSTQEKPKYTGGLDVFPGRYRNIIKYFNEIWFLERTNGAQIPTIKIAPDYSFKVASSELGLTQAELDKPDIEYLIAKALTKRGLKP